MIHNGMFGGGMWFGWIFFASIIGIVIYLISKLQRENNSADKEKEETPIKILKRRYANGEIAKEEYLNIKKDL